MPGDNTTNWDTLLSEILTNTTGIAYTQAIVTKTQKRVTDGFAKNDTRLIRLESTTGTTSETLIRMEGKIDSLARQINKDGDIREKVIEAMKPDQKK